MFYSTCGTCSEILEVTFTGQDHHPSCKPSEIFQLTSDWCNAAQREDVKECNRLQKRIDRHDKPAQLGPSALWYAQECHWPVFPLRPGTKLPATKNGFKDASLDPDQIREWWQSTPDANIGIPTGQFFDVIDIDGPEGIRSMVDVELPPIHGKVGTPRGFHLLTPVSGDGNRVAVKPGVDYRGVGGFIVASPSIVDGKRYTWLITPSPEIMKVPENV